MLSYQRKLVSSEAKPTIKEVWDPTQFASQISGMTLVNKSDEILELTKELHGS
jgi:hypothetical protein